MTNVSIAGYDITGFNTKGERVKRSFEADTIGEYSAHRMFNTTIVVGSLWRVLTITEHTGLERQHRTLIDRIH